MRFSISPLAVATALAFTNSALASVCRPSQAASSPACSVSPIPNSNFANGDASWTLYGDYDIYSSTTDCNGKSSCIELRGVIYNDALFEQDVPTVAGTTYTFTASFYLIGFQAGASNTAACTVVGADPTVDHFNAQEYLFTVSADNVGQWVTAELTYTADGPSTNVECIMNTNGNTYLDGLFTGLVLTC